MKPGWVIKEFDRDLAAGLSAGLGVNTVIAALLCSRGITDLHEAFYFLNPQLSMLHSPFLFSQMDDAVARIRTALDNSEVIGIFSDSDLDGLTSLSLLTSLLSRISPELKVHTRYPRDGEQYGITREIVKAFASQGVSLMITLDSGIRDVDEIAHASELGIETIVCDHHEPDTVLPSSIIINPKLKDSRYPFRDLAGVGVAFKLSHAVLMSYLPSYLKTFLIITEDQDIFQSAFVINGVVISSEDSQTPEQLQLAAEKSDFIICQLEESGRVRLERILNGRKCYDLGGKSGITSCNRKRNFPLFNGSPSIRKIDRAVMRFLEVQYDNTPKISDFNNSILSLVALGSIADIVPLTGENRILVYHGIESLKNTNHKGLAKLIENRHVNAKTIGWHVAPVLNAPGRMGKTDYTAEFLLQNGKGDPGVLMAEIIGLNELRKNIVNDYCAKIFSDIAAGVIDVTRPLIFLEIDAPEGVAGLIANRITDEMNKPVIIIIRLENSSMVKGSGRVRGGFNFFGSLEPLTHLFEKIGGHAHAFGFTLQGDRVEQVRADIEKIILNISIEEAKIEIDLELPLKTITCDFIDSLASMEPYGHLNLEPLFISRNVSINHFRRFGTDNRHGKYLFKENHDLEAIGWGIADEMEKNIKAEGINIIYRLEKSTYNGKILPRMIIADISPVTIDNF